MDDNDSGSGEPLLEIKDFNGDGKADILFVFGKNKGNNKLTLWLSGS
jgi:hypothetical protein